MGYVAGSLLAFVPLDKVIHIRLPPNFEDHILAGPVEERQSDRPARVQGFLAFGLALHYGISASSEKLCSLDLEHNFKPNNKVSLRCQNISRTLSLGNTNPASSSVPQPTNSPATGHSPSMAPTNGKRSLPDAPENYGCLVGRFLKTRRTLYAIPTMKSAHVVEIKNSRTAEAVSKVFNTVELVESIFSSLGCADLARTMSVCRHFQVIVKGSLILQELLFARPRKLKDPRRIPETDWTPHTGPQSSSSPPLVSWVSASFIDSALHAENGSRLVEHSVRFNDQVFEKVHYGNRDDRFDPEWPWTVPCESSSYHGRCLACNALYNILKFRVVVLRPRVHHGRWLPDQPPEVMERFITNPPVSKVQISFSHKSKSIYELSEEDVRKWVSKPIIKAEHGVKVKHLWEVVRARDETQEDDEWAWDAVIDGAWLSPQSMPEGLVVRPKRFLCRHGQVAAAK